MSDNEDRARQYRRRERDVEAVFSRLGYDINDNQDMSRLSDTLRWAEQMRLREERFRTSRIGWIVSLAIAVFSAVATVVLQKFVYK